jgi:hypothetical protein
MDKTGKTAVLRQTRTNYPTSPDTRPKGSAWINSDGRAIYGLKVTARYECTNSICEAKEVTNNDYQAENSVA